MSTRRLLFLAPAQAITGIFPPLRDAGYELGIAENLKGASVFIRKSGSRRDFRAAFPSRASGWRICWP